MKRQLLSPAFLDNRMYVEAASIIPHIEKRLTKDKMREMLVQSAEHGCLRILQFFASRIPVTPGLFVKALYSCMTRERTTLEMVDVVCVSITIVYNSEQYLELLKGVVRHPDVLDRLLSRHEFQNIRSLNPVLISAIKTCPGLDGIQSWLIPSINGLRQTGRCVFADPMVMQTTAASRNINLIRGLTEYGAHIDIAFIHSVEKHDSVTAEALKQYVSADQLARAIRYAELANNQRMVDALK